MKDRGSGVGEVFLHGGPVDCIPPSLEVIGAAVLVVQVVGVLPDIAAEDRGAGALGDAGHERVVLVWGGADAEGLVGFHAEHACWGRHWMARAGVAA